MNTPTRCLALIALLLSPHASLAQAPVRRPDPAQQRIIKEHGTRSGSVAVPDLTGQDSAAARTLLVRKGLLLGSTDVQNRYDIPAGQVFAQNPLPHEQVRRWSQVAITIASPRTVVPPLTGKSREQAQRELESRSLQMGAVSSVDSDSPPGSVVTQQPGENEVVLRGSNVSVGIAVPRRVLVPRVITLSSDSAVKVLQAHHLVARISPRSTRADSIVAEQSPRPLVAILVRDTVTLVLGPAITVPGVTNSRSRLLLWLVVALAIAGAAAAAVAGYQKTSRKPINVPLVTAELRTAPFTVTPMHGDRTSRHSLEFVARPESTRYQIRRRERAL